ncbi:DNA-binding response regulator, NarL/FixJ family, contains REC and HTH domains [Dyadobacter sp. SG02]|uniref:response regulator transcription factor n=1 Tax=Dyadobacter sp. SG02 TaxID=1855291 RepID=UPI0008C0F936|nr:response regulator transcription factor [Dyadobacter sp. SG02]SEJ83537.1 DNA-binding response regulator, NarL/FixJ family, contains REC and HTH domains [Dyadobacter sp. SG02]
MKRVLIVDNQFLMRLSLRVVIRELSEEIDVAEAVNFKEALKLLVSGQFDLVILEVLMDEYSGIKMMEMIRGIAPSTAVLICSTGDELLYAEHYILRGASGFVVKTAEKEEILTAISTVINGNRYLSDRVHDRLLTRTELKSKVKEALTKRERQILPLILEGRTTKEISKMLEIHVNSINFYKSNIFRKMQVNNILELAEKVDISKLFPQSYSVSV